ncbi:hypothetical protein [Paraburkholderia caledonica]|uniref:Uncharacterized protein n=1 Tax=Paraburkholderia caledonica TaxID=134536 RepID=A0AB73ICG6_9BURK|nr:hypothetical protein [Paraburkholderia caledonica]
MSGNITPSQEQALLQLLGKVMEIMRDDKAVNPDDPDLGNLKSAEHFVPREAGIAYSFRNRAFPDAKVELTTWTDPLDYSDDRTRVQAVPAYFELWFHNALAGISRRLLEQRLDLASYWVDKKGVRKEGNDMGVGPPPDNLLHSYWYRANDGENGRFPVDVELFFLDPAPNNPSGKVRLDRITISRVYPYLTPAMRKKKREEQNQKKPQTYGYMELCTGATCPESGTVWKGIALKG